MMEDYGCQMMLFTNVENSGDLHSRVMSGEDLGCVLIKPALILDPLQVALAVYKAKHSSKMTTRGLHTEVLYNLGPTKNIGTSLKTFGLTGNEEEVLAVLIDGGDSDKVAELIQGERQELSRLSDLTDIPQIIKLHKLHNVKPDRFKQIQDIVLSRVAAKDVL